MTWEGLLLLRPRVAGVVLTLLSVVAGSARAGDWPRFRGPNGSGVSDSGALPVEFGPERNLDWAVAVSFGRSSPAVVGGRVFVTATDGSRLVIEAFDQSSGETLWRQTVERSQKAELYHDNDSATPSPVADGSSVFVLFHEVGVVAFDAANGKERWRHPLGPFRNFYGVSASPVLTGDRLLVVCDQALGSFVLALDKSSGEPLWRTDRPSRKESFATPVLYPDAASPREVLVYGSRWIDAYDVGTGEVVWSLGGVSAGPVASPLIADGRLFVTGKDHNAEPVPRFSEIAAKHDTDGDDCLSRTELEGTWMLRHFGWLDVDASGCVSAENWNLLDKEMGTDDWGVFGIQLEGRAEPQILWNYRKNTAYVPSPIVFDGVFYMVKDSIVSSLDPRTGELYKRGRLARGAAKVYASPVAGDGKVYFAGTDGHVTVIRADPQWEVLAVNDLGDPIYASPAIVDGHLYVRTKGRLYSFSSPGMAVAGRSGPEAPAQTFR